MEIIVKDYKIHNNTINFSIINKEINGITGEMSRELENILFLKHDYDGKIIINKENIEKEKIINYKKKISIIKKIGLNNKSYSNIYELMYYEIRLRNISLKDPSKKIINSLKIVGLNTNIIYRRVNTLSTSEQKLLQLAISLLSNPDTIIIEEPFKCLDKKNEKKILMLIQKIKDQYDKTIIIVSNDMEMLYKYTNHIVITTKNRVLIEGKTNKIFQDIDFLKKHKIYIPRIVEITYLAKKNKNVKLEYHKDIRDIIKDIYKHV